jgi:hypothetical protein
MSHSPPFALEELLELVVAVALGGHGPELADDRGLGARAELVDLHRLELGARHL